MENSRNCWNFFEPLDSFGFSRCNSSCSPLDSPPCSRNWCTSYRAQCQIPKHSWQHQSWQASGSTTVENPCIACTCIFTMCCDIDIRNICLIAWISKRNTCFRSQLCDIWFQREVRLGSRSQANWQSYSSYFKKQTTFFNQALPSAQ